MKILGIFLALAAAMAAPAGAQRGLLVFSAISDGTQS